MRIVHFLNHARKANGHVELAVDLACEQAATGHDVTFVAGPGDFDTCLAENGVRFVELPRREGGRRALFVADFARVCARLKPDIVNVHMVAAALAARFVKTFIPFGLVTTVHNSFDRQAKLMGVGERVIAVSEAVRREMEGRGIAASKLRTVRNGTIGGRRRPMLPSNRCELKRPSIASVAGLHQRKGLDTLIAAFAQIADDFPEAHLYLVGEGPGRRQLEEQVATSELGNRVTFVGYLPDPRSVLGSTDIFVLPSLAEPCGLALIEARQMGCACVATNVGGIPEVLGFGMNGELFPAGDTGALGSILSRLLSDRAERAEMANAARSDLDLWTVERMNAETVGVYRELRPNA